MPPAARSRAPTRRYEETHAIRHSSSPCSDETHVYNTASNSEHVAVAGISAPPVGCDFEFSVVLNRAAIERTLGIFLLFFENVCPGPLLACLFFFVRIRSWRIVNWHELFLDRSVVYCEVVAR